MTAMNYQITSYAAAQLVTGLVALIVAVHIWRRRDSRGGWPLLLLFAAIFEWALAAGLEAAAVPQELKVFWSKMAYFGTQSSAPLLLLFALNYTGRGKKVSPLITSTLFVVPVVVIALALTNEWHGLVWPGFLPGPDGTNSLIYLHGPVFWAAMIYIFSVVGLASAMLIAFAIRTRKNFRSQSWVIILASLFPWIGAVIYILGLNPFPGLDIVSVSFLFNGLLILYGVSNSRFLDLVPVASEFVFANLSDMIIVVDDQLRLIDFNNASQEILVPASGNLTGKPVKDVLSIWHRIQSLPDRDHSTHTEIDFDQKFYSVRFSPIDDRRRRFIGWAIILEDISQRKQVEVDLENANQRLRSQLEDIHQLQIQLKEQVNRDSLTGVFNRRYLDQTLAREIAHAARSGYPLSLIMMDVDRFKSINDRFGHKMGDQVISAIGKLLQQQTRESDCVGRYGGDEFLLVMPEMPRECAFERAELWREGIKAMALQSGDEIVQVTISIGIATFPQDGSRVDDLVKAADDAMYKAKESGRDRTVLA